MRWGVRGVGRGEKKNSEREGKGGGGGEYGGRENGDGVSK